MCGSLFFKSSNIWDILNYQIFFQFYFLTYVEITFQILLQNFIFPNLTFSMFTE